MQVSKEAREGRVSFNVSLVENMGPYKILTLTTNQLKLKSRIPADMEVSEGERLWAGFPEDRIKIFKDEKRVY
jgi:ABC-type sugar transport system ATPase subunit